MDQLRYSCYADKVNQLLINYNGDIFKCTARDFSSENRDGYLNDNGTISWNKANPIERLNQKMSLKACKDCEILPLCGGGCIQKISEYLDDNKCIYGYTEDDKKKIVTDRFYNYFVHDNEVNLNTSK